ncbi:hypothetical protein LOC67_03120 [Stieleria sp. JC731]|uniref:hypothetical protein n=1 Tax=Pirellulaceae TaxID=2691357 RepID=UPI001E30DF80|nr:hypothetical protein [Stieleria sp. JC731]MCC9599538.1 hypothetical protein [Stieleria sp. JC731]
MNCSTEVTSRHKYAFLAMLLALTSLGCDRLIHDGQLDELEAVQITWAAAAIDEDQQSDFDNQSSRYDWPVNRGEYIVVKPAPMGYLNSFSKRFNLDSQFDSPLVKCPDIKLAPESKALIREAYGPIQDTMRSLVDIDNSEFNGPEAFDLSVDGTRLVVLHGTEVVLYNLEKSKRIGSFTLPGEWPGGAPHAIRFCGKSKDFLVASETTICRIASRTGKVVAQADGFRERIVKWDVNSADKIMAMLTESGRMMLGDPQLDQIKQVGAEVENARDLGLSDKGEFLFVDIGRPHLYRIDAEMNLVHEPLGINYEGQHQSIVAGINSHAWLDGHQVLLISSRKNENGENEQFSRKIWYNWRPHLAAAFSLGGDFNSFAVVGQRLVDGELQWVLYDVGPTSLSFTYPIEIEEKPTRFLCSLDGTVVVFLTERGVRTFRRNVWQTADRFRISELSYAVINQCPMEEFERLYEFFGRQKRISGAGSPSQIQSRLLILASYRWTDLEKLGENATDEDKAVLEKLTNWLQQGGAIARTVSGYRHHKIAWNARGSGYADTVSADGWEIFEKHGQQADEQLTSVVENFEKPPALALSTLIQNRLDHGGYSDNPLAEVNEMARRAVELYPDHTGAAGAIAFKLLPQWFGEEGELMSFIRAYANLYEGSYSDIVYAQLIGDTIPYHGELTNRDMRSIDSQRLLSALKIAVEHDWPLSVSCWQNKETIRLYDRSFDIKDYYRYLVEGVAIVPAYYGDNKRYRTFDIVGVPRELFEEAELEMADRQSGSGNSESPSP